VLTEAAYAAAHRVGQRIVGAVCPTVRLAGGYSLGGGLSPLAPLHGLGVDNVLEWEVVTANGTNVRAAPDENADLYWALSGGVSGTYAIVVLMTERMHRKAAPTSSAELFINAMLAPSPDLFRAAIDAAHADLAPIVDSGAYLNTILLRAGAALL
jgi:FAD/FMN-containing dehydrogenase